MESIQVNNSPIFSPVVCKVNQVNNLNEYEQDTSDQSNIHPNFNEENKLLQTLNDAHMKVRLYNLRINNWIYTFFP